MSLPKLIRSVVLSFEMNDAITQAALRCNVNRSEMTRQAILLGLKPAIESLLERARERAGLLGEATQKP